MIILTTATNLDWEWTQIEVQDDRIDQFYTLIDTPEQYTIYQQGIQEGWITIIGPVNDNTSS
jgi:hypothetical protein